VMAPVIGYELHRRERLVPRVLVSGSARKEGWGPTTLNAFAANLAEPARARAAVRLYRTFQLRELPGIWALKGEPKR